MINFNRINLEDQVAGLDFETRMSYFDFEDEETSVSLEYLIRILDRLSSLQKYFPDGLAQADIPETKFYIQQIYDKIKLQQNLKAEQQIEDILKE